MDKDKDKQNLTCGHFARFRSGRYSTKFIAEEYPEPAGFKGVQLEGRERLRMVAVAAAIHQVRAAPDEKRRPARPAPLDACDEDDPQGQADREEDDEEDAVSVVESLYIVGLGQQEYRVHLAIGRLLTAKITALDSNGEPDPEAALSPYLYIYI